MDPSNGCRRWWGRRGAHPDAEERDDAVHAVHYRWASIDWTLVMNAMTKSPLIASVIAGVLLLVCPVLAGQASLSGPILGFVFSAPEEGLRPLRGVLGS